VGLGKNRSSRLLTGCVTSRRLAAPDLPRSQPGTQAAILRHVGQLKELCFPFSRAFFEATCQRPGRIYPGRAAR